MLKRITIAIGLLLAPSAALAQSSVLPYFYNSGGTKVPVGSSNPLPVTGSISASLSPFTPGLAGARGTPLTVTVADSSGNLPTNTGSVIVYNVGSNPMYCNVNGIAATTSDQYISSSGGWFNFGIPVGTTTLHCIATGGSTTANTAGGTGLGAGTGGGSGSGGGGAITAASGSYASGALSSGSIASGAYASGAIGSGAVASGAFASGALAAGSVASGAMVDLGAQADAACGTATGTCSLIALTKYSNATSPVLAAGTAIIGKVGIDQTTPGTTNAVSSTPVASELHIGEIASNQIKVQVAQTVTASAYSAGNALGGLMTVANAARVSGSAGAAGTGGILTGLQLNSKTIQTGVQVDVFIFDANPTGSTCTDKTAFVIAAADFDKVVGILTIPSTAANGAGWFGATTTGAVGIPTYYPITYDLASSTSIYACAVVRAAITPAATTDISFKYNILRN